MDYDEEWYEFTKEKLIYTFKFDNLYEVVKYLYRIESKYKLSCKLQKGYSYTFFHFSEMKIVNRVLL